MPRLSPSALKKRLTERDTDILRRVVVIHFDVALAAYGKIVPRVLGE